MDISDINLITLDLDDTLWPATAVLREAERVLHEWLRIQAANLTAVHTVESLRAHRLSVMAQRPEIAHDLTAVRLISLQTLLEEFGYSQAYATEAMAVFLEARNRVTPFPDVTSVLESLVKNYRVVSVTNGNADVRRTQLGHFFHYTLTAAEVGSAKPAPGMFQRALELTQTDPAQAVHVGDDPELDVHAAQKVGMCTVWVNRKGNTWPEALPSPDVTVRNFDELDSMFNKLRS